jgi:hypothetical protein
MSDPRQRRRQRGLAIAAPLVLLAHGLVLTALGSSSIEIEDAPSATPVLKVRSVPALAAPQVPGQVALPPPRQAPTAVGRMDASQTSQAAAAAPPMLPPIEVDAPPLVQAATGAAGSADSPPGIDVPVYATQLPPAGRWHYVLTRGQASGQADLSWQPAADGRYEIHLVGRVDGAVVLDWISRGAIDPAGIAPERFAIRRRGRDSQAANFQRDAGKITFSGPVHEFALLPGVQDRVSWMLQLPAIVEAAPQRFGAGADLVLMVVGARGGVGLWRFKVAGFERLGQADALRLVHESERAHDTRVEVWLDPARGHLPLRARLTQPEGGAPLELALEGVNPPLN